MSPVRRNWGLVLWLGMWACGDDAATEKRDAAADSGASDSQVGGSRDAATNDSDAGAGDAAADGGDPNSADAAADSGRPRTEDYRWQLPPGFPTPVVPEDNPMSTAKVELGRHLFYDKRLSGNQTQSCASCHKQALAFTDGRATGLGSTGKAHPRGPMSLANIAYSSSLTWANPLFAMGVLPEPLERQTLIPIYGDAPVELGIKSQADLVARLQDVPRYHELFEAAFPEEAEPISAQNIGRALAAFERVLISGNAAYDRFVNGDDGALSPAEKRGLALFTGERLQCSHCHSGFNFSEHVHYSGQSQIELRYRNTGLYNIDGKGAYPAPNTGVFDVTMEPSDMGKFKVPTLRNVALTAPYMHDGSIATLSEVLDHYAAGGRSISQGPNAGVGSASPLKDMLIHGFTISDAERQDLIAFLGSLSDEAFIANPALADPWLGEPAR